MICRSRRLNEACEAETVEEWSELGTEMVTRFSLMP